ncbi:MAG: HNH endonuclease [Actinomycetota bacterium]|nr:HNH endonuclease [Actinomycetota bacterium]
MFDAGAGAEQLEEVRRRLAEQIIEDELRDRLGVRIELSPARDLLDRVAATDPAASRDADLLTTLQQLSELRRLLDASTNRLLAEVEQRDTTNVDLGLRPAVWLADAATLPSGVARAQVRVAASLRDHAPEVADAWCQGRIGEPHAQLLAKAVDNTRIRDAFTPMIPSLLDDAVTLHFDMWRAQVIALIALLDADGDEPRDPSDDNRLGFTRGLSGRWILRGEFDAVTGGVIRDALNDRADRLFHARSNDEAVAGTDLIVPSQQRLLADALHDMARNDRAANAAAGKGGRAEILLHFDAVDLTKLVDDDGVAIGDTGYWAATCDPTVRGVVFGMHRTVLTVAKEQRLVSRAQRRAMDRRDGGCVFPRCTAKASWTDAHHVIHWRNGGPTDLANLASLCRYHHGVSHRKGWRMGVTDDEWFWWQTPIGHVLWSQRHGVQRTGPPPVPPPRTPVNT